MPVQDLGPPSQRLLESREKQFCMARLLLGYNSFLQSSYALRVNKIRSQGRHCGTVGQAAYHVRVPWVESHLYFCFLLMSLGGTRDDPSAPCRYTPGKLDLKQSGWDSNQAPQYGM